MSVIPSLMKSVFFSDCNYSRRMGSSSSSSFTDCNNHPFLQVSRFTHKTAGCSYRRMNSSSSLAGCSYRRISSSSSFSGRRTGCSYQRMSSSSSFSGRRNNHLNYPFLVSSSTHEAAATSCSPMSSSRDNDDLFLVLRYNHVKTENNYLAYEENGYFFDLSSNDKSYYFSLVSTEKCASVRDFRSPHFNVVCGGSMEMSSCEGLVLLHHTPNEERLWNPWNNQFKAVPPSYVRRPRNKVYYTFSLGGFGFDPKSRDYKIIRFVDNYLEGSSDSRRSQLQIEMYSLKNDSWKEISEDPTCHIFKSLYTSWSKEIFDDPTHPYFTSDEVITYSSFYANGCCHWETRKGKIVSFDFANESFSCISLPNTGLFEFVTPSGCKRINGVRSEYELVEFDGSLGVIVYASSRKSLGEEGQDHILDLDAEVWVLNDERSSWTRKLEIHAAGEGGWCSMLGFSSDNQLLFRRHRLSGRGRRIPCQLLGYDVGAKQVKKFEIYEYDGYMEVLPYFDSKVDFNKISMCDA